MGSNKRVRFSRVSVRTYAVTVGDSPRLTAYPIGLDWLHSETVTLDINRFEKLFSLARKDKDNVRKNLRGFRRPRRLSPAQRFNRLTRISGISLEDLYDLESARTQKASEMPITACCCDDETVPTKEHNTYQVVDIDETERAEL